MSRVRYFERQSFLEHFKEMYGGQDEQAQQSEQPDLGSIEVEKIDSEISSSELREAIFSQKNGKTFVRRTIQTLI